MAEEGINLNEAIGAELRAELVRFLRSRGASPEDAADLVQSACAAMLARSRHAGRPIENPRAYLYRSVRNAYANLLRSNAARERALDRLRADASLAPQESPEVSAPAAESRAYPAADCLREMSGELGPAEARALRVTDFAGDTQRAAAQKLGMPYSSLKSQVQRGRRQLRDLFDRCCDLVGLHAVPKANGCRDSQSCAKDP